MLFFTKNSNLQRKFRNSEENRFYSNMFHLVSKIHSVTHYKISFSTEDFTFPYLFKVFFNVPTVYLFILETWFEFCTARAL